MTDASAIERDDVQAVLAPFARDHAETVWQELFVWRTAPWIVEATPVPQGSVHRILNAFEAADLVETRDQRTRAGRNPTEYRRKYDTIRLVGRDARLTVVCLPRRDRDAAPQDVREAIEKYE